MRDTIQEIVFGVTGQTLYLDAPEGVPSAVTSVTVVRSDGDDASPMELTPFVAQSRLDSDTCPSSISRIAEKSSLCYCTGKAGPDKSPGRLETADD